MPQISPQSRRALLLALKDAFQTPALFDTFLRNSLSKRRSDMVSDLESFKVQVDNVIRFAEGNNWVLELIRAALVENPTNIALQRVQHEVLQKTGSVSGDHLDACVLWGNFPFVDRFDETHNDRFRQNA